MIQKDMCFGWEEGKESYISILNATGKILCCLNIKESILTL